MKKKIILILLQLKKHSNILLIVVLFFNSSCNPEKHPIDNNLSYIYLDSLSERNIITESINNCHFVKLQTIEECLIKWIVKIKFDDNKIFIKDTNNKIFVFDHQGRFLNTIGKIGLGPDEQLVIFDFDLNTKSKIITVFDIYKSTLFKYTYSGNLLGKEKFNDDLFANVSAITFADDRHWILTLDNDNTSLFNYGILDNKNKKRKNYIPYMAIGNQTLSYGMSKIGKFKETVYMCAFMSDTVYTYNIDSERIIPQWVFKGKSMPATKEELDGKTYDLALEALVIARNKHLSTGIDQLYTTDDYIHFTFSMNNSKYRVFFNTNSQSGYYYKIIPASLYTSLDNLIATTDKAFVCFIPADEALSDDFEDNLNLKEILEVTKEDDNPILAFYNLN